MRKTHLPPRLYLVGEHYYWKPDRKLRPKWKSAALGSDVALATAEAKRLNKAADAWLAGGGRPAAKPKVRLGPQTVGQLVGAYKQSDDWRSLRPSTQATYLYEFSRLEAEFGHEVAATVSLSRVDDWLESLRRRSPGTARHVLAKGRLLYAFAQRKELVPDGVNPFKGQRRIRSGKTANVAAGGRRTARFSWAEIQTAVAAADAAGLPSIGTALTIAFATVQRISDVIRLTRHDVAGGALRFTQSKTGFAVDMGLPRIVAERLAAAPPIATGAGFLIVSEETLSPYHEKTISRVWDRLRRALTGADLDPADRSAQKVRALLTAAGVPSCPSLAGKQLRDGRRSGFVQYVLDGASIPFVCSMSGHSIEEGFSIVEHYLPKTRDQADRAVGLLSVKWKG